MRDALAPIVTSVTSVTSATSATSATSVTSAAASAAIVTLVTIVTIAIAACGPPCLDDRCSLSPATPQTTRVDYTKPKPTTGSDAPTPGSAAPIAAGSGSGSAAPPVIAAGAGSGSGSGSGSTAPPPPKPAVPVPTSAAWELWDGNQFKMYVISRGSVAASTKLSFEFVLTPTRTPFIVTLEVRPPGAAPGAEGVWNDCPENKVRCDSVGAKTHLTKKAGQVLLQAGINWAVTGLADESKGTLVTWTNNLSREVFSLRLLK